ncbi:MAG: hypothetical protein JNJ45_11410 [Chthonomonas sp.]|nr:hypothetical protein [Chthonomonas sp.]
MIIAAALALSLAQPVVLDFKVNGLDRQALVFAGTNTANAPLVLCFHGHGGNMRIISRSYHVHEDWPEATVVYLQGLPTPGMTDPEGKKNGWEIRGTDPEKTRDVPFFDAVYNHFKKSGTIDMNRVYAMGHSNGGGMSFLLWAARGEKLAAVAPFSSGGFRRYNPTKQVPAFIGGGTGDETVKWPIQQASIDVALKLNDVKEVGKKGPLTTYKGANGMEVQTYITDGGHKFDQKWVGPMVEFFKRHTRK